MKKIIASGTLAVLLNSVSAQDSCTKCAIEGKCWHNVPGSSNYQCAEAGASIAWNGNDPLETNRWIRKNPDGNTVNHSFYCHRTEFVTSNNDAASSSYMPTTALTYQQSFVDGYVIDFDPITANVTAWALADRDNATWENWLEWEAKDSSNEKTDHWDSFFHGAINGAADYYANQNNNQIKNDGYPAAASLKGGRLMPPCVKFASCLAPTEYYVQPPKVEPVEIDPNFKPVIPKVENKPFNANWTEPWDAEEKNIKTWATTEDQWEDDTTGHHITVSWTETTK